MRRITPRARACRQRGAALLVAVFVMALATIIVADLLWRQSVLVRTIENQQAGAQARLLLHGAQDWARAILQDQTHPAFDSLSDACQPLAQTRLDQLGETAPLAAQATLEGGIVDAQARFNLRNLIDAAGAINPVQFQSFDKLATLLGAPGGTARLIALYLAQAYAGMVPGAAPGPVGGATTRPMPPVFPEDLAAIPGIDPATAHTLAQFVILLDQTNTPVNFNTAGPEVMAASIPELSLGEANALAAERDRAYFISVGDVQNRLHGRGGAFSVAGISTNSQYFIVHGTVRLERASTTMEALVRRSGTGAQGGVDVLWEREQ